MDAVSERLRATGRQRPIQIVSESSDGDLDIRRDRDDATDAGHLLDTAIPDAGQMKRIIDNLREKHPGIPGDAVDGRSLVDALRRTLRTLLPLRVLVTQQTVLFPPAEPTTRALLSALDEPPTTTSPPENVDLRDLLSSVTDEHLPGEAIRQAYIDALAARLHSCDPRLSSVPSELTPRTAGDFLLDDPVLGSEAVLDFLERLAELISRVALAIRRGCDAVADRYPYLADGLRSSRERTRRRTTDSTRPHVLVRIERDMAYDASDPNRVFDVYGWFYEDRGTRACPGALGEVVINHRLGPDRLHEALDADLAVHANQRTVVELMIDDLTFADEKLADHVDALAERYLLVLRPNRGAELNAWFANWHRVLAGTRVTLVRAQGAGVGDRVRPDCPAVLLVKSLADRAAFEALNRLGIPVLIWSRKGQVPDAPNTTSFDTPEQIDRTRRAAGSPSDPALVWHNPPWFPNGLQLSWRKGVSS
jgi:hypothetical protein